MTVVVTRDVAARFRGFLASCMLEIAPGVYTSPRMTVAVRERVWRVLEDWWLHTQTGSIVMTWVDRSLTGGQGVSIMGEPAVTLHDLDGLFLVRRQAPEVTNDAAPDNQSRDAGVL